MIVLMVEKSQNDKLLTSMDDLKAIVKNINLLPDNHQLRFLNGLLRYEIDEKSTKNTIENIMGIDHLAVPWFNNIATNGSYHWKCILSEKIPELRKMEKDKTKYNDSDRKTIADTVKHLQQFWAKYTKEQVLPTRVYVFCIL